MFVPPAEPWQLTIEARGVGAIASTQSGTPAVRSPGGGPCCGGMGPPACATSRPTSAGCPGCWCCRRVTHPPVAGPRSRVSADPRAGSNRNCPTPRCWPPTVSPPSRVPGSPRRTRPVDISEVPLERFAAALQQLADHDAVDADTAVGDGDLPRRGGTAGGGQPRPRAAAAGDGPGQPERCQLAGARVVRRGAGHRRPGPSAAQPVPWVPVASGRADAADHPERLDRRPGHRPAAAHPAAAASRLRGIACRGRPAGRPGQPGADPTGASPLPARSGAGPPRVRVLDATKVPVPAADARRHRRPALAIGADGPAARRATGGRRAGPGRSAAWPTTAPAT